jgi:hypothetical protein
MSRETWNSRVKRWCSKDPEGAHSSRRRRELDDWQQLLDATRERWWRLATLAGRPERPLLERHAAPPLVEPNDP